MKSEQFEAHLRVEQTHWWFTARRAVLLDLVSHLVPRGGAVLDLGCGTGGNAAAFAKAGYQVLGLDPAESAIQLAKERYPGVTFLCTEKPEAGADHLKGGGVVLLSDVLEHVEDDRELLASTVAVLPPGGHVVITVPADPSMWSAHDRIFGHYRRYERDALAAIWAGLPVEVRLLEAFNTRLYPLIALRRRILTWGQGNGGDLDVPVGPLNVILHKLLASEGPRLIAALDRPSNDRRRGVSLLAVLRRRA